MDGEPHPFVGPLPPPELVTVNPEVANLEHLRFRNPAGFIAGNIHNHVYVLSKFGPTYGPVDFVEIVREGVKVDSFFQSFKGRFKGRNYNSSIPPPMVFENSKSCLEFHPFISDTILKWVHTGVLTFVGRVGHCSPPHLVLPLTVEPSKPRLCHDERFLNLWIKDLPFKLDHLPDLPRYVLPGNFQTVFDDMSGYQHVRLHPDSETYFGLQWEGCYFTFSGINVNWLTKSWAGGQSKKWITC